MQVRRALWRISVGAFGYQDTPYLCVRLTSTLLLFSPKLSDATGLNKGMDKRHIIKTGSLIRFSVTRFSFWAYELFSFKVLVLSSSKTMLVCSLDLPVSRALPRYDYLFVPSFWLSKVCVGSNLNILIFKQVIIVRETNYLLMNQGLLSMVMGF